jgi:hypothetical protein
MPELQKRKQLHKNPLFANPSTLNPLPPAWPFRTTHRAARVRFALQDIYSGSFEARALRSADAKKWKEIQSVLRGGVGLRLQIPVSELRPRHADFQYIRAPQIRLLLGNAAVRHLENFEGIVIRCVIAQSQQLWEFERGQSAEQQADNHRDDESNPH